MAADECLLSMVPRILLTILMAAPAVWSQGIWEVRSRYPLPSVDPSVASARGQIYVLGGREISFSGQTVLATNRMAAYDPRSDIWTEAARLPTAIGAYDCNFAGADGKLYVLGCRLESGLFDGAIYEFDPDGGAWRSVGNLEPARAASGVAVIGSKIYVGGGVSEAGPVALLDEFDVRSRTVASHGVIPGGPRSGLSAQALNGFLYFLGGSVDGQAVRRNDEYDPAARAWRARQALPVAATRLASASAGNRIQVFGGEGGSRRVDEYDPQTDRWMALTGLPAGRSGQGAVALDLRIFVAGGWADAGDAGQTAMLAIPMAERPLFLATSVLSTASLMTPLAPGSLASVFGVRLAPSEQVATRFPLPVQMNGVTVTLNGTPMPLLMVNPGQVNFHIPYEMRHGPARLVVSYAGAPSAEVTLAPLQRQAPAIFRAEGDQGAIQISGSGLLAGASGRPAKRGEMIEIYAAGLGGVDQVVPAGGATPAAASLFTLETPAVLIGNTLAEVVFSGLAPGLVGVYQVTARVPDNAPVGSAVPVAIRMMEYGFTSNLVTMAVAPAD